MNIDQSDRRKGLRGEIRSGVEEPTDRTAADEDQKCGPGNPTQPAEPASGFSVWGKRSGVHVGHKMMFRGAGDSSSAGGIRHRPACLGLPAKIHEAFSSIIFSS